MVVSNMKRGRIRQTPDISPIINEIISLDGWEAGNNMMLMVTNPTLEKEHREAESFDGEPGSAPKLVIEFDEIPKPLEITIADGMDDVEEDHQYQQFSCWSGGHNQFGS